MKYAAARPYADSEKAARKLLEIATEVDVVQDGRIHIEKLNGAFLHREKGFQRSTAQPRLCHRKRLAVAARNPELIRSSLRPARIFSPGSTLAPASGLVAPSDGRAQLYLKLVRRSQSRRGNPLSVLRRLHLSAAPQVSRPKGNNDHNHRYQSGCPQQT
jgi:hypothetical protein